VNTHSGGVWVARGSDGSEVIPFLNELAAHRYVQRNGYYLEVLCIPYGEDARTYRPRPDTPPPGPAKRS
jgi:hypothetical protein